MTVFVDASVAAKWFVQEKGSAEAESVLASEDVIAPDLLVLEVLNTIWKNVRLGRISPAQMKPVAMSPPGLLTEIIRSHEIAADAGTIAIELCHPLYDCLYLALAVRGECAFVTADHRLCRKLGGTKFERLAKPLLPPKRARGRPRFR